MEKFKTWITRHTTWFIIAIVLLGFSGIAVVNFANYGRIIATDVENITRLTASGIYSEIDSELTKPIMVSLTMANDLFLKDWLRNETAQINDRDSVNRLRQYLYQIQTKYNYNAITLVSEKTKRYYHHEGLKKIVSTEDKHDVWYYSFVDSKLPYRLDVDHDENNKNTLTIFADSRVTDENGNLMGVIGIGVKMVSVQQILQNYEDKMDLKAMLINGNGLIQAHTDEKHILKDNIFDLLSLQDYRALVLDRSMRSQMFWHPQNLQRSCVISRYIPLLDWYLVVVKNTEPLKTALKGQLLPNLLILLAIIGALTALVSLIVIEHAKAMKRLGSIDPLTELRNRHTGTVLIEEELHRGRAYPQDGYAFILDIDFFKRINEQQGHDFADTLLKNIGALAAQVVGKDGMLFYWGGDELCGIVHGPSGECLDRLQRLISDVHNFSTGNSSVSISMGVSTLKKDDTLDSLLSRLYKALVASKSSGRNRMTES